MTDHLAVDSVELSGAVQLALQAEGEVVGHRAHKVWKPRRRSIGWPQSTQSLQPRRRSCGWSQSSQSQTTQEKVKWLETELTKSEPRRRS